MPRPKSPLLTRRRVLQVALDIIDSEGLDALRVRRLADELGVNGASLYHHFPSKNDIMVGAAELALQHVMPPGTTDEDWPVWISRTTRDMRLAMLRHPNLIPVVLEHAPLGIGTRGMESSAALLELQGVPVDLILPLVETLEMIAISSAMYSRRGDELGGVDLDPREHPTLVRAAHRRDRAAEQLFNDSCAAVITSIQERVAAKSRPRQPRAAKRVASPRAKAAAV